MARVHASTSISSPEPPYRVLEGDDPPLSALLPSDTATPGRPHILHDAVGHHLAVPGKPAAATLQEHMTLHAVLHLGQYMGSWRLFLLRYYLSCSSGERCLLASLSIQQILHLSVHESSTACWILMRVKTLWNPTPTPSASAEPWPKVGGCVSVRWTPIRALAAHKHQTDIACTSQPSFHLKSN